MRLSPEVLASYAAVYDRFNIQPHLISRPGLRILRARADRAWEAAIVAARSMGRGGAIPAVPT